jgi:dibenzofuran dioxygenase subunit beta
MTDMLAARVSRDLQHEIEQFLYDEAELLDDGRFYDWLELFTDDTRYWLPVRETLQDRRDGLHPEGPPTVALMDDDKMFLTKRVKRLDTGLAHAETPPSRTRRFISNVRIREQPDGELVVRSNFLIYQARQEQTDYQFFGQREDRLRKTGGTWRIAQRKIVLDHTVLPRAISTFF